MSLYLTIFDDSRELTGWVFGHYSDFSMFRKIVAGTAGEHNCPILLSHSDGDGEWSPIELRALRNELDLIAHVFRHSPPVQICDAFEHSAELRKNATSLYDCFHNVDGSNLFDALLRLCDIGEERNLPVLFQ
jgi:hypothetical protein